MEIHKPKPWHGWREFLKEYLIIVVGVLTALGAEQVAENLHWRHQIAEAREALAFDMKRVASWSAMVDYQAPCMGARLAQIDAALDKAQETGRLPPFGRLPTFGRGAWVMRSWTGLNSGQTLSHMPSRDQISLSALAIQVDVLHQNDMAFMEQWITLQSVSGPGRKIDSTELASLRRAVHEARRLYFNNRQGAVRTETFILQTGVLPRAEVEARWKQSLEDAKRGSATRICAPIPPTFTGEDWYAERLADPVTPLGAAQMDDSGIRTEKLR